MALLKHMEQVSLKFLEERHGEQIARNEFRMGFHGPGHNSQHHLHLHLIVPPFFGTDKQKKWYDDVKYGSRLITIDDVIRWHDSKQSTNDEELSLSKV